MHSRPGQYFEEAVGENEERHFQKAQERIKGRSGNGLITIFPFM